MKIEILVLSVLYLSLSLTKHVEDSWQWSWKCSPNTEKCKRAQEQNPLLRGEVMKQPLLYGSLEICRLVCGKYGALWPKPTISTALVHQVLPFHPGSIKFEIQNANNEAEQFLLQNIDIFQENLWKECGTNCALIPKTNITILIHIRNSNLKLNWNTNESYTLDVDLESNSNHNKISATINSETVYGARHGLETLLQFTASYNIPNENGKKGLAIVAGARIIDKPVYPHRGLLLDTGRNFLPVNTIKRQLDAMAASKLNVFHWHLTDSQSFPFESPRVPQLTRYGAYSANQIYKVEEVKNIIKYARIRGIQVIPEIDAPSHAGNGWQWGKDVGLGDLAVCVNQQPWRSYCIQPPCGQLNPANKNMYKVLGDLYSDIIDIFNEDVFHMGGDEVFLPCWNSTKEIVDFLKAQGKGQTVDDFLYLWGQFQNEVLNIYDSKLGNSKTPIILWSSELTTPGVIEKYLPNSRYIIQTWVPASNNLPTKLLELGYHLIISTKDAWYLDHGFWGSTQYHGWRTVYKNRLPKHPGVLGGEACMWGELVDKNSIDPKIWPRTAAFAERMWSDPDTDTVNVEGRFYGHRERLVRRGIQADALVPKWCYQNEGECS